MRKFSQQDFLNKCVTVHNSKYIYTNTLYLGALNKVEVICPLHGSFFVRADRHLNGTGCKLCLFDTMRLSNSIFIDRAKEIHGDKYIYDKTNYVAYHTHVVIICRKHGEFAQEPAGHLTGRGCLQCGFVSAASKNALTIDSFISKANIIHGHKYDYSKFIYVNNNTKGIIICSVHGEFEQIPGSHLVGSGCPICAGKHQDTYSFIEKSITIHQNRYDYSLVNYIDNTTPIIIICPLHGKFKQRPNNHLFGKGCKQCAIDERRITKDEFIVRSQAIHQDRYDYDVFEFIDSSTKGKILCKKHNKYFSQTPSSHLAGHGCPTCGNAISKLENVWLDGYSIPEQDRQVNILIGDRRIRVDGYSASLNTIYEFYGDIWHGNPNRYQSNEINPCNKRTYKELYDSTIERERLIKDAGYNLVTAWESDFKKTKE